MKMMAMLAALIAAATMLAGVVCEAEEQAALGEPGAAQTGTLTAEEASRLLERDWLFQAMNEPLRQRAAREIGWARELARRLGRSQPAPDLSAELAQLEALSKRLAELSDESPKVTTPEPTGALPGWIWYPEGRPAEEAPAATRFFRRRFEAPEGARGAELRIAADDSPGNSCLVE